MILESIPRLPLEHFTHKLPYTKPAVKAMSSAAVPATCCGREGGCMCAKEAKCSCGKEPAMRCTCEKAQTENKTTGARCSCSMSPPPLPHLSSTSCTCSCPTAKHISQTNVQPAIVLAPGQSKRTRNPQGQPAHAARDLLVYMHHRFPCSLNTRLILRV